MVTAGWISPLETKCSAGDIPRGFMNAVRLFIITLLTHNAIAFGQQIKELPAIDSSLALSSIQTGFDYDGDKGVEIIAWFGAKGGSAVWKPCVFSTVINKYLYISPKYFSTTSMVTSGDFNGDGRMDIAVGNEVICFGNSAVLGPPAGIIHHLFAAASPNPFRRSISVRFHLPQDSKVTVSLFTIQGKETANLYNGFLKAGPQDIRWNSKKHSISPDPYILKVSTDNYSSYQLITCLK
jgi:hypothetical protein